MARKSSGCVVYRFNDNNEVEVLLVSNRSGKEWVFPKGGVEPHLTSRDSAIKEVWEEAGVEGQIGEKLGKYRYVKGGVLQKVTMYEMLYLGNTETWPEEDMRVRQWFDLEDSFKKVDAFLAPFLYDLKKQLFKME